MTVGDRISELLQNNDMTQKQLALELRIAVTTMNGYVKNHREPDFATLKQIARYFHVSCDYLLDYPESAKEQAITVFKSTERELIANFRKISPKEKQLLSELAEILAEK